MALDRGSLSENNRHTCQNIRQTLIDAIRAYKSAETDYTAHRDSIRSEENKLRQLENQLNGVSASEKTSILNEISDIRFNIDFHSAAINQLDSYLTNYENQIYQLSREFDNNTCYQFFNNPGDSFSPVPTS